MTIALVDGDIIVWRCAAVNEGTNAGLACWQADELVKRILEDVGATESRIYISGENNFRYGIYPDYKANRRDKPRPKFVEDVREHLVLHWSGEICDGIEADDALGINAGRIADGVVGDSNENSFVICSIDKDLFQIPGRHYNFVRNEFRDISGLEGWYNFYLQVLTGDPADNISGCPGIGKVKAPRTLQGLSDVSGMYEACLMAYENAGKSETDMNLSCQLLYILRSENDTWIPPKRSIQEPVADLP